ncbi:putative ribonuclease H-like domain-containing protein [Tanacetum coccineum]
MYSFFANQSSGPQLDHEDLEQLDEFDLEEMDLKWQVAMISMRLKKFYKKTGRKLQFDAKEPVGFDKTKVECYNCHKTGHFARECRSKGNQDSRRRDAWNTRNKAKAGKQEEPKALVTLDGDGVYWTSHSKDEQENYALMAYINSGSDTEIRFMKIDLDDKTDVLTYHKKLLAEAEKEKEELKAKVEKWYNSSKSLNILLNSPMSVRDKARLGYGDQMNKGVLSYENEVFGSLFYSRSSDIEDSFMNDRYAKGMHAVPPLMTGIYILSGPNKEIDESQFTYGPNEETLESMLEPVVNEPKVVSNQKSGLMLLSLRTVLTKTGRIPVNTARASSTNNVNTTRINFNSQTVPTNAARKVNTVKPIVNNFRPKTVFHKTHSPIRRPLNRTTAPRTNFSNQKVNTAKDYPQRALKNKGIVDSGCSRHMTGNKAYLAEYQDYNGGPVAFGGSKGYITGKDTECLVLSPDFKLPDENQVLLRVPRQNNMYSFNLENIVPSGGLACLIAKATVDESNKWHRSPVRSVNQVTNMLGQKDYNHSAGAQDNIDIGNSKMEVNLLKDYFTNEKPVDKEDQAFLDELERLKRQEKEADVAAEALRKEFAQDTEDLLLQIASGGLSYTDLTNTDKDDSQIPALEDIYDNLNDGIFTNASYDNEGAVDLFGLASYMGFIVLSDGCKEAFCMVTIDEEYMCLNLQVLEIPSGLKRSYQSCGKLSIGLHHAPRAWFQVTPSPPFIAVKRIFRRLISWQYKKQTIMATSTTEEEYVGAANCYGQVLFNFLIVNIGMINQYATLVKGRQDNLLYNLYEMFYEQKNLDNGDVFHRVIWVLESNWRELWMPDLSPRPSSSIPIPDSNPEGSGGNHREIKDLKAQIKQLKKKARHDINHHKAWFRAARLKKQQKKKDMEKSKKRRSISKTGEESSTLNEAIDYTLAQEEGKTDSNVEEPKKSSKTEELHLSDKSTNKQDEGTDRQVEGTAENKDQDSRESATPTAPTTTSTPTSIVFGDDETIA